MWEFRKIARAPRPWRSLFAACILLKRDSQPRRLQDTRWSSKKNVVEKEAQLRPVYTAVDRWPPSVTQYFPDEEEQARLDELLAAMRIFESISKAIQGEGTERQSLSDVREMFDGLYDTFMRYPVLSLRKRLDHLRADSDIVNNPDFEKGIVKIQRGEALSAAEELAVKMFKRPNAAATPEGAHINYAEMFKKKQKMSEYLRTEHVLVDSNICERCFSQARRFMHYLRAHMDPSSLELLLFLHCNKDLWKFPRIIDHVKLWNDDRKKKARDEAAAAAAAAGGDDDAEGF
jgi:hypothetical protein